MQITNINFLKSCGLVGLLGLSLGATAQAQDDSALGEEKIIPMEASTQEEAKVLGWGQFLSLGLYGTINENENVVGKDDGQTTTAGLKVESSVDLREKNYQWLNSFSLLVAFSRTPQIPKYLKSEDTIEFESLYKRYLESPKWVGFFAQFRADSVLFDGYDTQPTETTYRRVKLDGTTEIETTDRIKLTDRFFPLKFKESVGMVASPYREEALSVDFRLGVGLRQVQADDQFVVNDSDDTPERDIVEIESYQKGGYEVGASIKGATEGKKITYSLDMNALFPVIDSNDDKNDKTTFEKRIIDVSGKASFHLLEWASIDYILKVVRDPDILDKSQVSQSLLFSVNKTFTSGILAKE